MATWKVAKDKIKIFPHPNADKLEVGLVGQFQVVVEKGRYQDGDEVIFIPAKSLLPDVIAEPYRNYLVGPEKNRVHSTRLRGELSMGVIYPADGFEDVPLGEDISERLGITEYFPPIPVELAGDVYPLPSVPNFGHFDVEQPRVFAEELVEGEQVFITEKLHGTQLSATLTSDGVFFITSKGLAKRGVALKESDSNAYWRAARDANLRVRMEDILSKTGASVVQVFGEVVRVQKGFHYGFENPTLRVYETRLDGVPASIGHEPVIDCLQDIYVPLVWTGPYSAEKATELAKGNETLTGKGLHIKEGVVVSPVLPRYVHGKGWLYVKFLNPKYQETGEEIN